MGRDKSGIVLPDGRTMARRAGEALLAIGASEVVGLGGPPSRAEAAGLVHVTDAPGPPGPLAGLESGLRRAGLRGAAALVVLPTDLPRVEADALAPVVEAPTAPEVVVVARLAGRPQYAVSRWPASTLAAVAAARRDGVASFQALVGRVEVVEVDVDERLADADVPGDLDSNR